MSNLNESQNNSKINRELASISTEQYELLSAYLDGEVTLEERRQVEGWLSTDSQFKAHYLQWLELRAQWRSMPVPSSAMSSQQLANQLFKELSRRTYRTLAWSGTAIAAVLIATISGLKPSLPWFSVETQYSQSSRVEPLRIALHEPVVPIVNTEAVQVSVDQPLIQIPKATHSSR